jgi:hypothetical protein
LTETAKVEYTCVHKIWQDYHHVRCGKKADERGFCKRHTPEAKAARAEKQAAKDKARSEAWQQEWTRKKERERNADRYEWLRQHPAFETEAALGAMTPEQYDAAVDEAMK